VSLVFQVMRSRSDGTGPVKVDAKHYKVDFENAQVGATYYYGPHEKSSCTRTASVACSD